MPKYSTTPIDAPSSGRRQFMAMSLAVTAATMLGADNAWAAFPGKPVRIVVPLAAGGPTDVMARLLAEAMTPILGQQVLVENRPGASGQIAVDYAARADADGYTILMATIGTSILPQTNAGFNAEVLKKLKAITKVEGRPVYLVASSKLPAKNIFEVIAYAKANPGQVRYAAQGASDILAMGLLSKSSGVDFPIVRYQGGAPALQAVVAGQVQLTIATPGAAMPFVKSGELRVVAVTSTGRLELLPDVPAIAEAVPGYEFISWTGLLAPAGTPREAIDVIASAAQKALTSQMIIDRFKDLGTTPDPSSPEEFTGFFQGEIQKWSDIAKSINFTPQ